MAKDTNVVSQSRSLASAADAAFASSVQTEMIQKASAFKSSVETDLRRILAQSGYSQADQNSMFSTVTAALTTVFSTW